MDGMAPDRIRSVLFAPGNQPRKLERVFDFGADAVDLDLEDAVPEAEKTAARALVQATLQMRAGHHGSRIIVRLNGPATGLADDDARAVVQSNVFAIHLTKLREPGDVTHFDHIVSECEQDRGLPRGHIRFICSVDSVHLAINLRELATASPRLYCLILGGVDFAHDIGVRMSHDMLESLWLRSYGVLVSRDAGLAPPLHPPVVDFRDDAGMERVLYTGKQLGFQGAIAIHPRQVDTIHRVFAPSEEDIRWAMTVIQRFEAAEAAGSAAIQIDGRFVDYALVKTAHAILQQRDPTSSPRPVTASLHPDSPGESTAR